MGLGVQAKQDEFKLNDLLKVICVLYCAPSQSELALKIFF